MSNKLIGLGILYLVAGTLSAAPAPLPLWNYAQTLEIEFSRAADAGQATLSFAPVYDNREWAFSARWDDNNPNSLNMVKHMNKYGVKGNFYLTAKRKDRFGPEFCQALMQGGCAIGGHTMTHPKLPELQAGEIWWQIMANRVGREDDTEGPVTSFAFSYGQFKGANPEAFVVISEAVRRSGYRHCVYSSFVRDNPNLVPGELSSGVQLAPGDSVVDVPAFKGQLARTLKSAESCRKWTHCIHLGVHPRQTGGEWDKFDAVLELVSKRADWWYCSQNEWAAYTRAAAEATLKADPAGAAGARRRYTLSRPQPADLGADVPLTLLIQKAGVKEVRVDGQSLPVQKRGDLVVVNLPHESGKSVPRRVGQVEMPAVPPAEGLECPDFPGFKALLKAETSQKKVRLTLQAPAGAALSNLRVRFRLPLAYDPGVVMKEVANLAGGAKQTMEIALPEPRAEAYWHQGPQYWVAEIDFTGPNGPGRLFVTKKDP